MSAHETEFAADGLPELDAARLERLQAHVRGILVELGLDLQDPNLVETDRRVARMYLEMFRGLCAEGAAADHHLPQRRKATARW